MYLKIIIILGMSVHSNNRGSSTRHIYIRVIKYYLNGIQLYEYTENHSH